MVVCGESRGNDVCGDCHYIIACFMQRENKRNHNEAAIAK